MTPTEDKPKRQAKEKPQSLSIFVSRERVGLIMSIGHPTDNQRDVLRGSIVKTWPRVFEMKISQELTDVLKEINVAWSLTNDGAQDQSE